MKLLNILFYYILLLLGLIGTSWIIWSRFIHERTIRDIPSILTEYLFWFLIYICCIYLYAIKFLLKKPNVSKETFSIMKKFAEILYKPLTILDHLLKYNKYCKNYYYNLILYIIIYLYKLSDNWTSTLLIIFDIIPRIILVVFLLFDTFYFNKLELFYKVILIGILPFIFRYIQYSIKDVYDHWLDLLTNKYKHVYIFEKGYEYDISRKDNTEAVWHFEAVSVKQYIEVMHDTYMDQLVEGFTYEYVGIPFCKEDFYLKYEIKFNKPTASWNEANKQEIKNLFYDLEPKILSLKILLENLQILKDRKKIVWPKIGIFSIYLICWSYILMTSYYNYPIELNMFNYLIKNIMIYLTVGEDPFNGHIYSLNKNLITIKSIKNLVINIINKIIN